MFWEPGTTIVVPGSHAFHVLAAVLARSLSSMKTCDLCGRRAEDAETLTWSTSQERGRQQFYCETCSREHLRSIEGKLDSAWW